MEERNKAAFNLYKDGKTLEELAKFFKVTRSRVQQIVIREMEKDIIRRLNIDYLSPQDEKMLRIAAHEEIQELAIERDQKKIQQKKDGLIDKIKQSPLLRNIANFPSVKSYADALGISSDELKKFFPNTVQSINQQNKNKWSRQFEKCIMCGTTATPHRNRGYCQNCFSKTPFFKEMIKASFLRHADKRKKTMKKYMEEYKTRPEVIAKYKKLNDQQNFGGNRLKTIERDDYKCTRCGITQEQSYKKFSKDLFVQHKEGKSNNLENLITVCQNCHSKKILKLAREIGNETLFQKYTRLYKN